MEIKKNGWSSEHLWKPTSSSGLLKTDGCTKNIDHSFKTLVTSVKYIVKSITVLRDQSHLRFIFD